jgi:predicted ATP-dependent protease
MAGKFEVPVEKLSWHCDLSFVPFTCTDEMTPLADFIGQDRAIRAIQFGLGLNKPGFNIFVTGLSGTGKTSIIKAFLKKIAEERGPIEADSRSPEDWCYVYNFADADRPQIISMRRGWGRILKNDMEQLILYLQREGRRVFESDEFARNRQALVEELQKKQQGMMEPLMTEANETGFTLRMTPSGMALLPIKEGKPMQEADYLALSVEEKKQLEDKRAEIEKRVEETLREGKKAEREVNERLEELEKQAGEYLVRIPLAELREKYRDHAKLLRYFDGLRDHILKNLQRFKAAEAAPATAQLLPVQMAEPATDPFLPYRINVLVDNSDTQGPPIIVETNPSYHNLFGVVEKKPVIGGYVTDFTLIKAGSMSKANGGYIVLYDRDVLANAGVWEALLRVIKNRELRIEEPAAFFGWAPPQGLRPEPIPTDTKVIIIGDPHLYRVLAAGDPDFREAFKVKADFDSQVDRSQQNIIAFACFISDYCNREGLRHFDNTGVARVIEECSRMVENQEKLSTRFSDIVDLLIESDYWARQDKAELISAKHVEQAVVEKTFRLNLIEKRLQELITDGTILVDVEGTELGQINGLAVYQVGDFSFGKPSRITAKTFMGRGGVVNIEREAKLSGKSHDKGVLILSGYLGSKYAQEKPLSLSASICFEQSYDGVDGDSASSTELYAILSSLAGVPLKQNIAVTGSVNQNGEIQAIGGINRKIEGFYDVCRAKGLTGDQGVLMPTSNLRNLMLRADVIKAVEEKKFHVYAVQSIDEGIEVLTDVAAGTRNVNGKFPEGSINALVEQTLMHYAERQQQINAAGVRNDALPASEK